MSDKKLNIAYIGNGKSTNRYHLPFVKKLVDKINVKTIYERSDKSKVWDRFEGTTYTNDIEEILTDPEIDAVIITTPSATHYELAKKVLESGKNVIVEKPFSLNLEEARELINLAKEKDLIIQSYQNRRFDSDFLTAQKIIESGILGDVYEIETNYDYYRPEIPTSAKAFKRDESFLYTHACHTLDQVISYFGEPLDVKFDVRELLGEGRMNDYFDIDLYYPNLKISVRSSYFRVKSRPRFAIYGTKGTFIKETEDQQERDLKKFYMPENSDFGLDTPEQYGILYYYDKDGKYHEEKIVSEVGDYSRYYKALYETIINGKEPLVKENEILTQMQILDAAASAL